MNTPETVSQPHCFMRVTTSSFDRNVEGLLSPITVRNTVWFISILGRVIQFTLEQNYDIQCSMDLQGHEQITSLRQHPL